MSKIVIHKGNWIARLFLKFFPDWVDASTLGRHIFTRSANPSWRLLQHESVHVRQYKKHGIIKFLWVYFWVERNKPYKEKTFEREAYRISGEWS